MFDNVLKRFRIDRRTVFTMLTLLWACESYDERNDYHTPPRLLDRACKEGTCSLDGVAKKTAGITEDSIGFVLGPGEGEIVIQNTEISEPDGTNKIWVLSSGKGMIWIAPIADSYNRSAGAPDCPGVECYAFPLTEEYQWIKLYGGVGGVVIHVENDGSTAQIADIRQEAITNYGCSVATIGRPLRISAR